MSYTLLAWFTNKAFIDAADQARLSGELVVPIFQNILTGPDCDQWGWHPDPETNVLGTIGPEVCDSVIPRPTFPDFCPWGVAVLEVKRQ